MRSRLLVTVFVLCGCNPYGAKVHPSADRRAEDALSVCASGATLAGVDVSVYQGTIDWPTAEAGGIVWAYAKATEGLSVQDSQFTNNWTGMKAAGVYRGAYHFFYPEDDGTMQADYFLAEVGTLSPGDLPPMLDWEVTNGTSGATAQANAQAFIEEILAKTGMQTVIYTSSSFLSGAGVTQSFAAEPLWVADWQYCTQGCCPDMAADWTSWVLWQWSDQGTVSGISPSSCDPTTSDNCVDLDIFNGDLSALAAFAGGSAASCPSGLADGYYCGGTRGITGDANTLYQCSGGTQITVEPCATWCASSAEGDFCAVRHRHEGRADINGDGEADLCARAEAGIECWLSTGDGFQSTIVAGPVLDDDGGWADPRYDASIHFADVDGDGRADICARSPAGFQCWLGNGSAFPSTTTLLGLSDAESWGQPQYGTTVELADINGDGKLDVCARAEADETCWLFDGTGFTSTVVAPNMGDSDGWNVVEYYSTIMLGDVTGDGRADLCGRGWGGFECWVSTGTAFTPPTSYIGELSDNDGGAAIDVYSTIQLADVNGDGKLDVCARLVGGFECWLADGTGGFPTAVTGPELSDANGWNVPAYFSSIAMADINGDGKADVCGRDSSGYSCWLSTGSGFSAKLAGPPLSDAAGWSAPEYGTTLDLADINGDGMADLCARSSTGTECWLSTGSGFAASALTGPTLTDATGWGAPAYFSTLRLVGSPGGVHVGTSGSSSSGALGSATSSGSVAASTSGGRATSTGSSGSSGTSSTSATTSSGATGASSSSDVEATLGAAAGASGGSTGSTHSSAQRAKSSGCGCTSEAELPLDTVPSLLLLWALKRRRVISGAC